MYCSRLNIDESVALTFVAIAWIASLACGWLPVLHFLSVAEGFAVSGIELMTQPSLLTAGAVLSVVLWRNSRAGDQQLLKMLLSASHEWRQGSIHERVTHIGGKKTGASTACLGAE